MSLIPCFKCVTLAACRVKPFHKFYKDCTLIQKYLHDNIDKRNIYHWIELVIDPTEWFWNKKDECLEKRGLP